MNKRQTYTPRRARSMGRNQNSVSFATAVKLGPVMNVMLVALMITVLGLIYLTQATKATGYDYAIQDIDAKIADLTIQKNDLEVENARLMAIKKIEASSVASNMSTPNDVQYVE